jgi:hypothetical protein
LNMFTLTLGEAFDGLALLIERRKELAAAHVSQPQRRQR